MRQYLVLLLLIGLCFSCEKEEDIPSDIPLIAFRELAWRPGPGLYTPDTVSVSFSFVDGGADIGLHPHEMAPPYQYHTFFYVEDGQLLPSPDIHHPNLVKLGDLPGLPPFSCHDYYVHQTPTLPDTLYYRTNPHFYNVQIDLYVKQGDSFRMVDLARDFGQCGSSLNGRIPALASYARNGMAVPVSIEGSGFDIVLYGFYAGEVKRNISARWSSFFSGKTIKLKLRLTDRKLQSSNEIETSEITIP